MWGALLITFREVIEAALILSIVVNLLLKLNQKNLIRVIIKATVSAFSFSLILVWIASVLGYKIQQIYTGRTEEFIEGTLMIISAIFITGAIFFLHRYTSKQNYQLTSKIKDKLENQGKQGLFILVFTAVFREGFEIVLFLSSLYLTNNPNQILIGFFGGIIIGIAVAIILFRFLSLLALQKAIRITNILLILFAAGLLARGIAEFTEAGILPQFYSLTIPFLHSEKTVIGSIIKTIFGITKSMNIFQIATYLIYSLSISWYLFFYQKSTRNTSEVL